MIVTGIVCLVIGYLIGLPILFTVGIILITIGIVLSVMGRTGHPVAHRKYWY